MNTIRDEAIKMLCLLDPNGHYDDSDRLVPLTEQEACDLCAAMACRISNKEMTETSHAETMVILNKLLEADKR